MCLEMTKAIFIIKRMWNTFWVCLNRSAESATGAISVALHSVSQVLKNDPSLKKTCYEKSQVDYGVKLL